MSKKISYSAWKKYHTCPAYYDFHYHKRLRPIGTSSALVFGSAIDEALNQLLLHKKDPIEVFKEEFSIEKMQGVVFDPRDFDKEIFTTEQLEKISGKDPDYQSWASLRIKGRMLLNAYIEQVHPLIKEVYYVQKEIEGRPGQLDAMLNIEGFGKVLVDHKTAARPYRSDAVVGDTQLALYAAHEGVTQAGFVVLLKEIQKNRVKICRKCGFNGSYTRHKTCPQVENGNRCHGTWDETIRPEASIQIIIDDIPDINKKLITESIDDTEKLIKAGHFPKNLSACGKIYGKPCPYINKCWKNDESMLEYKIEREVKKK